MIEFDDMRLDQQFSHAADAAAFTDTSIWLGHKLGLEILAEGVETRAQYEFFAPKNAA